MPTQIRRMDGWIPGHGPGTDPRDYNIRQLLALPPAKPLPPKLPSLYWTVQTPIVLNQGSTPECVAYASSGMKTDEEYQEWNRVYKFNAGALYAKCKQQDGSPNDPGTWPKVACDIMLKQGMALGCSKKFDTKWGINGYYGITTDNTDDEIKAILYQYGTMLFASYWYDNWMDMFEVFPSPGNQNGGHCYRCVGWVPIGWIIVNSWGKGLWGNFMGIGSGIAIMPYGTYRQFVLPDGDSWKVIDKP